MLKSLEETLRDVEIAEEPGEIVRHPIIQAGDAETPSMEAKVESAGYVYIYDTLTGERSITNRNMLRMQLRKKREDGSYVFTTIKPNIIPKRGNLKCMLHAEAPNRAYYDTLGFAICKKDNITSPFEVMRHMQKRHKMEWQAIEMERQQAEREEDKKLQRALLKGVARRNKSEKEV